MKYFVVVKGSYNKVTFRGEYEVCIGICKSYREAYGMAYLALSEEIRDQEKSEDKTKEVSISAPYELEADAGFGMKIINDARRFGTYANVLFYDDEEEQELPY